jgi:hypothetical protein
MRGSTNYAKSRRWAWKAVQAGALGLIVGGVVGASLHEDLLVAGLVYGPMILGGLPLLIAIWFLFLHMIGQVSDAGREGNQRRRRRRRVEQDEDEYED